MAMNATQLRKRLYEVLRGIEQSGEPVEIELKDSRFIISKAEPPPRLARMQPQRNAIAGSLDDLAATSPWDEAEWRGGWDEQLKKP